MRIEDASSFKAVLQVNPNALTAAQGLDDERYNQEEGSRHGAPLLLGHL